MQLELLDPSCVSAPLATNVDLWNPITFDGKYRPSLRHVSYHHVYYYYYIHLY